MEKIAASLVSQTQGPAVANLQDALLFLFQRGLFVTRDAPNNPAQDELAKVVKALADERAQQFYGEATQRLVLWWQLQSGLGDNRKGNVDDETADSLNGYLQKYGAFEPPVEAHYIVRGHITGGDGKPLADLVVRAFDQDLRIPFLLGVTKTDAQGAYEIAYLPDAAAAADAAPPGADLFVVVAASDAADAAPLASSAVCFNAGPVEVVDFVIASLGETEFTRIAKAVLPLLEGQSAAVKSTTRGSAVRAMSARAALRPDELNDNDVAFLSRETGLDVDWLAAWIASARMRAELLTFLANKDKKGLAAQIKVLGTEEAWAFFYAARRASPRQALADLLRLGRERWEKISAAGVAAYRIGTLKNESALFDALELVGKVFAIDPTRSRDSRLARAVALAQLPMDLALKAADIAAEKSGALEPDDFLSLAEDQEDARPAVNTLVRTLRLQVLTGHDERLTTAIAEKLENSAGHTLVPLAAFSTDAWTGLVTDAAGSGVDAYALQTRALHLQQQVEQTHPLESLNARFSANMALYEDAGFKEGAAFLKEYGVADQEGKIAIVDALNDPLGTRLPGDAGTALAQLGLYGKGGVNLDIAAALIKKGLKTPAELIRDGLPGGGKLDIDDMTLPPQFVEDLRDRFREAVATGVGLWIDGKLTGPVVGGAVVGGLSVVPEGPEVPVAPSFAGIFGALDECLCQPHESVLGLPAYLADLLHELGKISAMGSPYRSALETLKARRPDIFELPLSSENADKEVLHIELAVAAMESLVAKAAPGIPAGTTDKDAATQQLRKSSYPWNLPCDGDRDLAVSRCERLGFNRARLLSSALSRPELLEESAAAWLGISLSTSAASEWKLLIPTISRETVWAYYGFADATGTTTVEVLDPVTGARREGHPGELLARLSILLDRTGLDLETLTQMIACKSIALDAGLAIQHEDEHHPCKVSEMILSNNSPALFDRLHRFVRLWRRLDGWSVEELDVALLHALANGNAADALQLTDAKLAALGQMQRARVALGLLPAELLGLYPAIATDAQNMLLSRALKLDAADVVDLVKIFDISGPATTPAEWFKRLALLGELAPAIMAAGVAPATLRVLLMRDPGIELDFSGLREDLVASVKLALSSELASLFGKDRVDVVMREIVDLHEDPGVVYMMTEQNGLESLPDGNALFTVAKWEAILRYASPALRHSALLAHIHERYGDGGRKRVAYETLRDQALIEAVQKWAASLVETQAQWPVALIDRLLGQGLTLDPSASAATAREWLLGDDFLSGAATGVSSELVAWARRLKLLLMYAPSLGRSDEWLTLESVDWRQFVEQDTPSERMKLVYLLLVAQPDRLSLAVVQQLLAGVDPSDATPTLNDRLGILENRLGHSVATLIELVTGSAPDVTDNAKAIEALQALRRPEVLYHLTRLAAEARRLKASGAQIAALLDSSLAIVAETAKQVLAARLGTGVAMEAEQVVRSYWLARRRDALVGWLVAQGKVGDAIVRDANDLYERLLIDPEMAPCFKTTPVLAAIGAVQLFVQRFLFGLESDIGTDPGALDTFRQRWEWMRSYRLWEANRKVFLFPENWLFPELRDDKSVAFKALEAALSRGELTQEIAEDAFSAFLDDVAHEGQIQVQGMFEDMDADGEAGRRDLYLVGRTPNPPYKYYWRYCADFGEPAMEWRPWEAIEFDIGTDHVIPFVLDKRLHIAWPTMRQIQSDAGNGVWQLDLNWSSLTKNGWRPVKTSRSGGLASVDDQEPPNELILPPFSDERIGLTFRCDLVSNYPDVVIKAYVQDYIPGTMISPEQSPVIDSPSISVPEYLTQTPYRAEAMKLIQDGFDRLTESNKKIFYAYFCHLGSIAGGTPARSIIDGGRALPSEAISGLVSAWFQWLDCTDFQYTRTVFDEQIRSVGGPFRTKYDETFGLAPNTTLRGDVVQLFMRELAMKSETVYALRTNELLSGYTQREVKFRAWAKIRIGSGIDERTDYVELKGTDGSFSLLVDGQAFGNVTLGASTLLARGLGGLNATSLTLKWSFPTATGNQLLASEAQNLDAVPGGKLSSALLTCVFDATAFGDLGLVEEEDRTYSAAVDFHLSRTGQIEIRQAVNMPLPSPVSSGLVYMNGFRERAGASGYEHAAGLAIAQGGTSASIDVFPSSKGRYRYWIVGAGRPGDSVSQRPMVWSFSEGPGKCLVDLTQYPDRIGIYPDGWYDEVGAITEWAMDRRLPSLDMQKDSFGSVEKLPASSGLLEARNGNLTFDNRMPYAIYNWEAFYHAPLLVAGQLAKQHRFEDADRWLRLIFDPTIGEQGSGASQYMRFRVFRDLIGGEGVRDELQLIARIQERIVRNDRTASVPRALRDEDADRIDKMIERWRDQPYRPFLIARRRQVAFLWKTLSLYVDNLVAWADDLFRRDTRETVAEATMLYVLAARIIGRRPRVTGKLPTRDAKTFSQLEDLLDDFSNAWISVSGPAMTMLSAKRNAKKERVSSMQAQEKAKSKTKLDFSLSAGSLYFCIPFNDKLTGYWDIVEDRLFKIRHCRNIDGMARELPFVDPPIDPELLVRAVAAGLDIGDVLAGLQAPPPHQRFAVLHARASELANETRNLGGALLAALEKRDAEALGLLRASHEVELLKLVNGVRRQQIAEAQANIDALRASRKSLEARFEHLARQLGKDDLSAPEFGQTGTAISMLGSTGSSLASNGSGLGLIHEEEEQNVGFRNARDWAVAAGIVKVSSGASHSLGGIPTVGPGFVAAGHALSAIGDGLSVVSQEWRAYADQQGTRAGHIRRRDDWAYQANQALKEIAQIDKQILASQIRQAIAEAELTNQTRQIEQAQAVGEYLRTKYTNVELYQWMEGELSSLHSNAYRLALDLARQAQNAAIRELGMAATGLKEITNTHWNGMRSGLLAGEKLGQDLKRLELAYHKENRRELELTKHVSLRLLAPQALVQLKTEGVCEFSLPEWLFDMDAPGHYLRRIKTVSLSVPCVVGPYTGVNCTLTLLSSDVRRSNSALPPYLRKEGDDSRFDATQYGKLDLIVTSSGRDDSGLFEVNLRDERYLPFEHAGAISKWRLEIPNDPAQFDHDTISDVILHLRYTARSGGDGTSAFAQAAKDSLKDDSPTDLRVLLSLKNDFSAEWLRARSASGGGAFSSMVDDRFRPYWARALGLTIDGIDANFGTAGFLGFKRDAAGILKQADDEPSGAFIPGDSSISLEDVRSYDDVLVLLILKR